MIPQFLEIPYQDPCDVLRPFAQDTGSILLESARFEAEFGRYSFLVTAPWQSIWTKNGQTFLDEQEVETPFFDLMQQYLLSYKKLFTPHHGFPPFQGGMVGYLGYDAGHLLEELPRAATDEFKMPDAWLGFYDAGIAFDHLLKKAWIFSTGLPEEEEQARQIRAQERQDWILNQLSTPQVNQEIAWIPSSIKADTSEQDYLKAVKRVIDYIHAGDIYQANYSQRLRTTLPESATPYMLYKRLKHMNAAPFAAFLNTKWGYIASASPERFLKLENKIVETKPIKGTRRRSTDPEEDKKIAAELLACEKDRAENIMIVDLLRNDLSRVCAPHSVKVPRLLALESYATVHHLVTTIVGELEQNYTAIDLLKATFPGGSITGAPKIRSMEIITELEQTQRGPFYGSIGYIGFDGNMDTNIVIRTFLIQGDQVTFQVGGGIVADSAPEEEYEESKTKAVGMIRATGGSAP